MSTPPRFIGPHHPRCRWPGDILTIGRPCVCAVQLQRIRDEAIDRRLEGPHHPSCLRPWVVHPVWYRCVCAAKLAWTLDHGYVGQRMRLLPPDSPFTAHERIDSGGILYHRDGGRTSWYYAGTRLTGPNW